MLIPSAQNRFRDCLALSDINDVAAWFLSQEIFYLEICFHFLLMKLIPRTKYLDFYALIKRRTYLLRQLWSMENVSLSNSIVQIQIFQSLNI